MSSRMSDFKRYTCDVVMLVGKTGAGKTWTLDQIHAQHPGVFNSLTQRRQTKHGHGMGFKDGFDFWDVKLQDAMHAGKPLIVDRCNIKYGDRRGICQLTSGRIIYVVFDFSREVLERNALYRITTGRGVYPGVETPEKVKSFLDMQYRDACELTVDEILRRGGESELVMITNHPDLNELIKTLPSKLRR